MKKFMMAMAFGMMMLFVGSTNAQTVQVPSQQSSEWRGKVDDFYRYTGVDIDVQLGAGYHWDTADKGRDTILGMGRLRVGVLHIPRWPWAFSAGMTIEPNTLSAIVWGGQVEVLHLGAGLWARGGIGADYYVRPHVNFAIGHSLFGVEVQGFSAGNVAPNTLNDQREGVAVLAVIRIPVGYLLYVFDKK